MKTFKHTLKYMIMTAMLLESCMVPQGKNMNPQSTNKNNEVGEEGHPTKKQEELKPDKESKPTKSSSFCTLKTIGSIGTAVTVALSGIVYSFKDYLPRVCYKFFNDDFCYGLFPNHSIDFEIRKEYAADKPILKEALKCKRSELKDFTLNENIPDHLTKIFEDQVNKHSVYQDAKKNLIESNAYLNVRTGHSPKPALKYMYDFLYSSAHKVCTIEANAGGGKSIFSIFFCENLSKDNHEKKEKLYPIHLNMPNLHQKGISKSYIHNFLRREGFSDKEICKLQLDYNLVVVFDGYDEVLNKPNIKEEENFKDYPNSKFIVLIRMNHLTENELGFYFNFDKYQKAYRLTLAPLNQNQQKQYIKMYRKIHNKIDGIFKTLEITQKNLKLIWNTLNFDYRKLNPFFLKISLETLDQIGDVTPCMKYKMLDSFFNKPNCWMDREADRTTGIFQFNQEHVISDSVMEAKQSIFDFSTMLADKMFENGDRKIKKIIGTKLNPLYKQFFENKVFSNSSGLTNIQVLEGVPIDTKEYNVYSFKQDIFFDYFVANSFLQPLRLEFISDINDIPNKIKFFENHVSNKKLYSEDPTIMDMIISELLYEDSISKMKQVLEAISKTQKKKFTILAKNAKKILKKLNKYNSTCKLTFDDGEDRSQNQRVPEAENIEAESWEDNSIDDLEEDITEEVY